MGRYRMAAHPLMMEMLDMPNQSLCTTCQLARNGCEQPGRHGGEPIILCDDYRAWTAQALHDAQCAAARQTGSSSWHELCRLIEIEQRYLTTETAT